MASKPRRKATRKAKPNVSALRRDSIPRALIGREVQRQILSFGLTRGAAAAILREAPSQMSRLMTGHIAEFSADRLVKMLMGLSSDVTITIQHRRKRGRRGRVRVRIA
jgi:predicted XRE-type DNA-binding protein